MRVELSTAARTDLAAIGEYIERGNPARALSFTDELISACDAIADAPLGAPVVRTGRLQLRRKVYRNDLIFY